jgi:DNA-binding transcriptional MerR regulator
MSDDARNTAGCSAAVAGRGESVGRSQAAEDQVLTIRVVAKMFRTPMFMLRLYELRGLIRRQRIGQELVYSWSDCERIALLTKARKAGLTVGELQPVIKAMGERVLLRVADRGRLQCLSLIHALESQQQATGNVLGELYRIDWELSERLGVKDSGGTDAGTGIGRY